MSRNRAILSIVLAFLLGILAGGAGMMRLSFARFHAFASGGPDRLGELIVHRLDGKLQFTAEQRASVEKIVNADRDKIKQLHKQMQPQMAQIVESGVTEIRALLIPEQAVKFDEIVAKGRSRWEHPHKSQPF